MKRNGSHAFQCGQTTIGGSADLLLRGSRVYYFLPLPVPGTELSEGRAELRNSPAAAAAGDEGQPAPPFCGRGVGGILVAETSGNKRGSLAQSARRVGGSPTRFAPLVASLSGFPLKSFPP